MKTMLKMFKKYLRSYINKKIFIKEVIVDLTGKVNGRGAYLKKDKEVFLKARKTKVLNKILECNIDDSLYDELDNIL